MICNQGDIYPPDQIGWYFFRSILLVYQASNRKLAKKTVSIASFTNLFGKNENIISAN
ncbi:hypothetical protein [Nostoc sp. MS1]|uniref:hypothetical protein n=1 Tax=Nostoc sp. MS1 TaxID=2764711 RepID=UPI001CC64C0D|nr:hypothetical protein [Nostoc sp. MS1]